MINLYPHQESFIRNIKQELAKGNKHLLCQSPTGSGKTVMFSFIVQNAQKKGSKTLVITDRNELLTQSGSTLEKFGVHPSYIKAGAKIINRSKNTFVAMSQTLRNRVQLPEWREFIKHRIDIVIIDEAHIQEFNYLFEGDLMDDKIVLGFTATPIRTGKMRQLGLDYDRIIRGEPIKKLIADNYLVNCDIYDCGKPDLSGISMNYAKGDYAEGAMFKVYDNPTLYKGLTSNYLRITPGQKMIVFCCNVEHAIKTTIELHKEGINAKFVCSAKTPPKLPSKKIGTNEQEAAKMAAYNEKLRSYNLYIDNFEKYSGDRKSIFDGFKNNSFSVLVNVDIATKGYDCPDIQVVALYRATASLALYLQMAGRGGRITEGKTHFTMFDFGGNKERFGGYDQNRVWSLWHEESVGGGIPPMKECGINANGKHIKSGNEVEKGCKRLILAMYMICPFCGFKYPEKNEASEIELMLESIKDEQGISLKSKPFKDMTHKELHKYRELKAHRPAWLWRIIWLRGGDDELMKFADTYHWGNNVKKRALDFCKRLSR